MDPYKGEIQLPSDGAGNLGALQNVLEYVQQNMESIKTKSPQEKEALEAGMEIVLRKLMVTPHKPRMVFENFSIRNAVGVGSYGKIWMAEFKQERANNKLVALKQLESDLVQTPNLWKERDFLIELKHDRICNLIGAFVHTDVFLVMELCYGSVATKLYQIDKRNAVRFAYHLLEAVSWMHSRNIVHADIKSDNCLINQDNNLVLSDFGSAFKLKENQDFVEMSTTYGSPGYQDLEASEELQFSKRTDMFAVACVLFEMDHKRYLLLYQMQQHTRALYIDALKYGRAKGLEPNSFPSTDMPRESLYDRAFKSEYVHLIRKLIAPHETRITAEEALADNSLRLIKLPFANTLSSDKKEEPHNFVTREFFRNTSEQFAFFGEEDDKNLLLLPFYYDEKLTPSSLDRWEPGVISSATTSYSPRTHEVGSSLPLSPFKQVQQNTDYSSNDGEPDTSDFVTGFVSDPESITEMDE